MSVGGGRPPAAPRADRAATVGLMTSVSTGTSQTEPTAGAAAGEPRSLADELRARDDQKLAALLRARPELATPVPADVAALAAAATARPSTRLALDRLDTFALQVVDALTCLPDPATVDAVLALLVGDEFDSVFDGGDKAVTITSGESVPSTDPSAGLRASDGADQISQGLRRVLAELREQALVWGPDHALRLVRTARDVVGAYPAGVGPALSTALAGYSPSRLQEMLADLGEPPTHDPVSAVAAIARVFGDRARMEALLAGAPAKARELLSRLAWGSPAGGPPVGEVKDALRPVRAASARTAIEWLLARGLLTAVDAGTVTMPREVALHLRGGRLHRTVTTRPPALATREHDVARVNATAAGSAFTAIRQVEELLELWGHGGPPVLRSGGLGVRELRRTAQALDVEEPTAALLAELAYAGGLLGPSGDVDEVWLPTPAYDNWRAGPPERRWASLATTWLATSRTPGLVGSRDEKDRPVNGLGPDVDRASAPAVRQHVLLTLASLPVGVATTVDAVRDRLAWERPRRGSRLRDQLVSWSLQEAERLGLTGLGSLTEAGRAVLAGDEARAADLIAPHLPEPLDHVLIQADLTAIAPGPLTSELRREMAMCADVESTGGATVYRFTEASVRRALDAGRTADELRETLARHSRTPVPQPLAYLITDVARRHGRLRVGAVSAYLRCDDDALVAELLADRRTSGLGLRRLAPTVLVSSSPVDMLLERLRAMGYAPTAEGVHGEALVTRPDVRRTPPRQRPPRVTADRPPLSEDLLAVAVRAIRAGDRAATAPRRPASGYPEAGAVPHTTPAQSLTVLAQAAAEQRPLWIGYVNAEGRASQRVIEPIQVEGGYVRALDHLHDEVRTFALHRITGVAMLTADEAEEAFDESGVAD